MSKDGADVSFLFFFTQIFMVYSVQSLSHDRLVATP